MITQAVLDEVLANHFRAIAEEMSNMVLKSAHTTFVKETQDYATALITPDGEVFAYPKRTGVTALMGIPLQAPIQSVKRWDPGDVVIFNDPFHSRGAATHLPDLHVLMPVHHDGEMLCFAWSFIHSSDVGGSIPGSQDVSNWEIFQEGLRLRPVKLYARGQLNHDIWHVIADNCRIPDKNWGDISAQVAALTRGASRLRTLADRYGSASLSASIGRLLDQTEARTRSALRAIPAGTYSFVDYLDDDTHSDLPVRIEVAVTRTEDGRIVLDFTGSDPQVRGAYNLVSGGHRHHPFVSFAITNYVATTTEGLHLNSGILRCIDLVLPTGSVLNAEYPASVAQRFLTAVRVHDAILGALAAVDGIELPSAGGGEVGTTMIAVTRPDGSLDVAVGNPVQGGAGGGPWADGDSGSDYPTSFLRSVPAEVLEWEMPVLVHGFAQVPDSDGAGRYRGGFGVEFRVELTDPRASLVMRGKERYRFNPWGVHGGNAGALAGTHVLAPDGARNELGKLELYRPSPGEVVCIRGAGGGYGRPHERDPELVAQDVRNGLVSPARARDVYRVGLTDRLEVDPARTRRLRPGAPEADRGTAQIDFGPARTAWERKFGEVSTVIHRWLAAQIAPHLRYYCRNRAFHALADGGSDAEAVKRALKSIESELQR